MIDADLNPGLAAELPAVVRAALRGNTQPLARLADLHDGGNQEASVDLSFALYAATVCRDGPFPWAPDTPVDARAALEQSALAALPPGAARARSGSGRRGSATPTSASTGRARRAAPRSRQGPSRTCPMLAVSGGFDMRTPTAGAASVVARFPQGKLLVVPGVGHSTVTADFSGCAIQAVHTWMTGGVPPGECARPQPLVATVPALPAPPARPPTGCRPAATLAVVKATLREAEAAWLMTDGLTGSNDDGSRHLRRPADAPRRAPPSRSPATPSRTASRSAAGSRSRKPGPPLVFRRRSSPSPGAAAATGVLGLKGSSLRGTLGGKLVG